MTAVPMPAPGPAPLVTYGCCDGCKTSVTLPADQTPPGWYYLEITKRWRCPPCAAALAAVNASHEN